MEVSNKSKVEVFNRDAESNSGYLYTTNIGLSSRLATRRSIDTIIDCSSFAGRSVLDLGCGDGYYSFQYWDTCKPKRWVGIDAAEKAIELANSKRDGRAIEFAVGDGHHLDFPDNSFDQVLIQSMLHHDDDPLLTIKEAFRVGREVIVHEPNGNNFGLKIIEKLSPHHREHQEKSYTTLQMARWLRAAGGRVTLLRFAGFVPMFCPDWMAKIMKTLEPLLEHTPLMRAIGCSVYVMVARRED